MYGIPSSQHYQSAPYGYSNPPLLPTSSTSNSLHALSQAALGHSNALPQQHDRSQQGLRPAPRVAESTVSEGGRSLSPTSATGVREDDDSKDGKSSTTKAKGTRKRGRKRIEEDAAAIEANDSLDADAKRKQQNRAAQRAFRERKERRVIDLEEKVNQQEVELAQCRELIDQLRKENEALRRGENPPPTPASTVPNGKSASPPDVKPAVDTPQPQRPSAAASPSFHNILNDAPDFPPSAIASTFQHPTSTSPSLQPPSVPEAISSAPVPSQPPVSHISPDLVGFDSSFDFDAPFDFSESMALPPLFASLLDDLNLPPSTNTDPNNAQLSTDVSMNLDPTSSSSNPTHFHPVTSTVVEESIEEPSDEDDPPPLPLGRIPCDKPECDFTAVSCALPIPWRPPNAPVGSEDKDLWIAQKCWAKLVSHPLFDRCDPDELCQELRDKTRCSDDGRLVCHKNDVCDIFRSIPQKAKLRQLLQE